MARKRQGQPVKVKYLCNTDKRHNDVTSGPETRIIKVTSGPETRIIKETDVHKDLQPASKKSDKLKNVSCKKGQGKSLKRKVQYRKFLKPPPDYINIGIVLCFMVPWAGLPMLFYAKKSRKYTIDNDLAKAWENADISLYIFTTAMVILVCTLTIIVLSIWIGRHGPEALKAQLNRMKLQTNAAYRYFVENKKLYPSTNFKLNEKHEFEDKFSNRLVDDSDDGIDTKLINSDSETDKKLMANMLGMHGMYNKKIVSHKKDLNDMMGISSRAKQGKKNR